MFINVTKEHALHKEKCAECKKLNHFSKVCQIKTTVRKGVHGIEEDESGDEELFVGCVISVNV